MLLEEIRKNVDHIFFSLVLLEEIRKNVDHIFFSYQRRQRWWWAREIEIPPRTNTSALCPSPRFIVTALSTIGPLQ